jgi:hypothetical protein
MKAISWPLVPAVSADILILVAVMYVGRGSNVFIYREDTYEFTLFTVWADRYKQILKKWRALPSDRKAPFLQQARENRAALRMKRAQQVSESMFVLFVNSLCGIGLLTMRGIFILIIDIPLQIVPL